MTADAASEKLFLMKGRMQRRFQLADHRPVEILWLATSSCLTACLSADELTDVNGC